MKRFLLKVAILVAVVVFGTKLMGSLGSATWPEWLKMVVTMGIAILTVLGFEQIDRIWPKPRAGWSDQ